MTLAGNVGCCSLCDPLLQTLWFGMGEKGPSPSQALCQASFEKQTTSWGGAFFNWYFPNGKRILITITLTKQVRITT